MTYHITDDSTLKTRVRSATGYADNEDELLESDLDNLLNDAKLRVFLETQSEAWYTDKGLGMVLLAYTNMRAKAAVENFAIDGYTLGNETVKTRNATPEQSQQIQQWADDVLAGLNASSLDSTTKLTVGNTSGYIGEHYYDSTYYDV